MENFLKNINNNHLSTRTKIIIVIEEILNGYSLSSMQEKLFFSIEEVDRAFAHELLLGTLRQWWALSRIVESLVDKKNLDKNIQASIHIGIYQLLYMKIPDYAAINDTVEAIKYLNPKGFGLVNAVLRKVQQKSEKWIKKVQKNHSLPNWLAKQLKLDWGCQYDQLGKILRQPAPIFLRVNKKFCSVLQYQQLLNQSKIDSEIVKLGLKDEVAIRLLTTVKISNLPKFSEGWITVQDRHAQLSAHLFGEVLENKTVRILDICAAPGGKTTHLLEMFHVEQLVALDSDEVRLSKVEQNIKRLNLQQENVKLIVADARTWHSEHLFDLLLLDAPCSATGVIRRHPDIALLRQEADIEKIVKLQSDILKNAWKLVKTGGYLLYSTCSLLKAENKTQIQRFLDENKDAKVINFKLDLNNQIQQDVGYQCLPLSDSDGDGFYYALLQKC